ncbi:GNAT family N-acetyltransferase [Rhodobacteraceae bacterium WD3A24]|nr:GNAT family N-acetyltransferase [Rhodobacteraceae bacterium WD3A24]
MTQQDGSGQAGGAALRIRPAGPGDAPAVAALWNPVIAETLVTFESARKSVEEIAALIRAREAAGHGFFVAEAAAGALAGFAHYGQFRAGRGYRRTMEHSIILGEAARGGGIGRAMMDALEAHARAGGAHSLIAGVSSGNPAGRAFHAAIGYGEIAVLPEVGRKFGRWLDLIVMQKFLGETPAGAADSAGRNR